MKTIAIINAGGTGSRFGHDTPKQYIFIDDKPMLYFSLKIFQDNKNINEIYVVSHKDYFEYITDICDKYNITKFVKCIEGGKTANESRYNGLLKLNNVTKLPNKVMPTAAPNRLLPAILVALSG